MAQKKQQFLQLESLKEAHELVLRDTYVPKGIAISPKQTNQKVVTKVPAKSTKKS